MAGGATARHVTVAGPGPGPARHVAATCGSMASPVMPLGKRAPYRVVGTLGAVLWCALSLHWPTCSHATPTRARRQLQFSLAPLADNNCSFAFIGTELPRVNEACCTVDSECDCPPPPPRPAVAVRPLRTVARTAPRVNEGWRPSSAVVHLTRERIILWVACVVRACVHCQHRVESFCARGGGLYSGAVPPNA